MRVFGRVNINIHVHTHSNVGAVKSLTLTKVFIIFQTGHKDECEGETRLNNPYTQLSHTALFVFSQS